MPAPPPGWALALVGVPAHRADPNMPKPSLLDRLHNRVFQSLIGRSLVYNTCWEDPAVDRDILRLDAESDVLVITSAGCNALDYLLAGARSVTAVDINPRQNALLELKVAAIRSLSEEQVFALFGRGYLAEIDTVFHRTLAKELSPVARTYWAQRLHWFKSRRGSFYFHGLSGYVAYSLRRYMRFRPSLKAAIDRLFEAQSIAEQRRIYDEQIKHRLWTPFLNRLISSQWLMNLLGVPSSQRQLVEQAEGGQAASFVRQAIEHVVLNLPLHDNYFWQVYWRGHYTANCCPEYLRPENIRRLREALPNRLHIETASVTDLLQSSSRRYSHFVLLDHMDWMSSHAPDALAEEWQAIFSRAQKHARILLRSAEVEPRFLNAPLLTDQPKTLAQRLLFCREPIAHWQDRDRVHTYSGLVVANAA